MILGVVRDGPEPVVRLVLIGAAGQTEEIEAVIDTGFTGELTLPSSVTALLGLQSPSFQPAVLADGTAVQLAAYPLDILRDGIRRDVTAMEAEMIPSSG
jgi:predicted aspartyl protease